MISKSKSNDGQNPTQTILDEPKAQRGALSDDLLNDSINTGTTTLIHLLDEIPILHSFDLLMLILTLTDEISTSPTLLAWSSWRNNKISIVELVTKQEFC